MLANWADMDFNSHMKGTAFLDKACDARLMFLTEHGYPMSEFSRLKLGPVAMRDELEYQRLPSMDIPAKARVTEISWSKPTSLKPFVAPNCLRQPVNSNVRAPAEREPQDLD
jgi:hypothetical protein